MTICKIQKRNGAIVDFDIGKIREAVGKAAEAVGLDGAAVVPAVA